jgi:putative multiple sugar transport system ATP-binding protein
MSIVMISSDLLEVIGMSDRIYVMADGKVTGEIDAKDATEQKIMEMATI